MNKTRPYSNISGTLSRFASRNTGWSIPIPTAPLPDAIRIRSKNRLDRTGKNLAKKGIVRVTA